MTSRSDDTSEDALVLAVAQGQHDALAEIYERHGAAVHEVAARLCGGDGADELVRQVFLDLWNGPDECRIDDETLVTNLVRNVHRMAIDDLRRRTTYQVAERVNLTPPGWRLHGHARNESAAMMADHAWPLLSQLPPAEHTAIWLTYFVGYRAAEVARVLGQSEATVHQRLGRGLQRLQALRQ